MNRIVFLTRYLRWSVIPCVPVLVACGTGGTELPSNGGPSTSGGQTAAGGAAATGNVGQGGAVQYAGGSGGAGGTTQPMGGTTGAGGTVANPPSTAYPYDTSVTFDWPESQSSGTCQAGHYSGSFDGFYASSWTVVGAPIPVAGNLSLTLDQSADGEFFTISGGSLCGLADGLFPFSAEISGTLDCKTGQLVDSKLTNGGYWFGVVVGPPAGTFDGPLPGTYDKLTHTFTGTWKVYEPDSSNTSTPFGGSGSWTTTLGAATPASQAGCAPAADGGAP